MVKRVFLLLLALLVLLCVGCTDQTTAEQEHIPLETTETTEPAIPEDGNPDDVTCKGSYSASSWDPLAPAAKVGDHILTNEQLQAWYWLEAAAYRQEEHDTYPDFSKPLDTQPCPVDDSVNSWQQYFLKRALATWHSVCALELQARELPLPTEDRYDPGPNNYQKYMTGCPATDYLYGYTPLYQPNSVHDAYLEGIPETLEELAQQKGYRDLKDMAKQAIGVSVKTLEETVRMYNYSYMYFTTLGYSIECTDEEISDYIATHSGYSEEDRCVDIRHILLVPDEPENAAADSTESTAEDPWEACFQEAEKLLKYWKRKTKKTEGSFADLAYKNSADTGSAVNGGAYRNLQKGQLLKELDDWCFDETRKIGDTEILFSPYGWHILYFSGSRDSAYVRAEKDLKQQRMQELVTTARENNPAEVFYSAITLTERQAAVSSQEVLYPDIGHERFPEIPLYLQQDYPGVMYGGFKLRNNGCGITSLAMLASYMVDDELTPPEMCARYGRYSHASGTDSLIFIYEPPALGFFLREKTYDPKVAKAALQEGQVVVSLQHKGYWTSGGHYIVLERISEDGRVQVRDSNLYNYGKLRAHKEDLHEWADIVRKGAGYWIFEDKMTRIPACSRCGEGGSTSLTVEYLCEKCQPALLRRNTYLRVCAEGV